MASTGPVHQHQAGAGARARGRVARISADVHHHLETDGLDAAAGAQLRPAGGFAGATTARSGRRRRKATLSAACQDSRAHRPAAGSHALDREIVHALAHQDGRTVRPAAEELRADRKDTLAAARGKLWSPSQQPARIVAPTGQQPEVAHWTGKSSTHRPARTGAPCGLRPRSCAPTGRSPRSSPR